MLTKSRLCILLIIFLYIALMKRAKVFEFRLVAAATVISQSRRHRSTIEIKLLCKAIYFSPLVIKEFYAVSLSLRILFMLFMENYRNAWREAPLTMFYVSGCEDAARLICARDNLVRK